VAPAANARLDGRSAANRQINSTFPEEQILIILFPLTY
jgi:hypothetical protein